MYQGNSIVDYLKSTGQPADYASRAQLAASQGIQGYVGSAEQNLALLNNLRGGGQQQAPQQPAQSQPQPQQTTPQYAPQAQPQAQSSGSFNPDQLAQALVQKGGYNPTDAQNAARGGRASELAREFLGIGGGGGGSVDLSSFQQPTINLPEIYENLYQKSGVSELETKLSDQTKSFNEAVSKINNNPFLSEANRVGKIQKLQTDFNNATAGTRSDIATKKADIETQLNLQTKQFDINSQQAQQGLQQVQALLQSGALDDIGGEAIAQLTRQTGLSSEMINSAINTGTASERKEADLQATTRNLIGDIQRGATLRSVVGHYGVAGGLSTEDIYRLYNTYYPYGAASEKLENVEQGKFND